MADRRNPYLILGLDYGAGPQQARAAFARLSRRLRSEPDAQYHIEDATWALHQIEHAAEPGADLHVFRVPANPDAYTYQPGEGILTLTPQNLVRRTGSSAGDVARMQAEVADQLATSGLEAAVDAWEAPPVPGPAAADADVAVGSDDRPARRYDPLAAALGNASLLGVGYVLLRRWGAAVAAFITSAVLLLFVAAFGQPGWFWRGVLTVWWVSTTIHGFRLARARNATSAIAGQPESAPTGAGQPESAPTGAGQPAAGPPAGGARPARVWVQRVVAAGVAGAVGAGVVLTAIDGGRIQSAAAAAHEAGDCDKAIETLGGLADRHRVVDPYLTRRADREVAACKLLLRALAEEDPREAAALLAQYLDDSSGRWTGARDVRSSLLLKAAESALDTALDNGGVEGVESAFEILSELLAEAPSRADAVHAVLTRYLGRLREADPCTAMSHLDWLRKRPPTGDQLDWATEQVDGIAPPVLLACGDQLVKTDGSGALDAYQTLLDRYPHHSLADDARTGVDKAKTRIEAERLRELVRPANDAPYCSKPARYRAAPAYAGGGPHLLLSLGSQTFSDDIPQKWRAPDPTAATLVLCVTGPKDGRTLRTCAYDGGYNVRLKATSYAVRGYKLRTGTLAFDTTISLGGACPSILRWNCPSFVPNCPPPGQIRAVYSESAFRSAISQWVFH